MGAEKGGIDVVALNEWLLSLRCSKLTVAKFVNVRSWMTGD